MTTTIEKQNVHQGVVAEIKETSSKFGHSWLIKMDHGANYYFSAKTPDMAPKMFEIGKKAAFTAKQKTSASGNTYFVIENVFYTF